MMSSNHSLSHLKKQLRAEVSAKRSALTEESQIQKSEMICRKAIAELSVLFHEKSTDSVLFTYIPFGSEVNIMPIVEWCWKQGIRVVTSKIVKSSKLLQLHYITSLNDLYIPVNQSWGIREPLDATPILTDAGQIACILMPGIAFDLRKSRLGYGGGYYDRYLQQLELRNQASPLKLALAYDLQIVTEIPCEQHDFAVDLILTENQRIE